MGEPPEWWVYFEAAAECNSQPWIVAGLPETAGHTYWVAWALTRKAALADARAEIQRNAEMRRG